MKKVFIIFCSCLLSFFALAQERFPVIQGISIFKIGALKNEILSSLEPEYGKPKATVQVPLLTNKLGIYKIEKSDPKDSYHFNTEYSDYPGHEVYYIPNYKIDELEIRDLVIAFVNDSLFSISTDKRFFILRALISKYGPGQTSSSKNKIKCRYVYTGAENELEESSTIYTWRADSVSAEYFQSVYYSEKCEPLNLERFDLYLKPMRRKIYNWSMEAKNKEAEERKRNFKKSLDKF